MSEFVKLTSAYVSGALYINPLHIEYFHARKDGGAYVCILADGDRAHEVTETPEQIMALIDGPADRDALVVEADSNAPAQRDVEFTRALAALVNCHSRENGSDTPDYLLADYLMGCLRAYEAATVARDKWCGYRGVGGFNAACLRHAPVEDL